nr:intercellular adhesion molecule 2-like isoform X2 [Odocoileus virginianus texanus]
MRKTHLEGTSWASIRGRETTRAHPPWSRPEAVMSEQGERSREHPLIRLPIVGSPIGQGSRGVCCPVFSVLPGSGEKAFEGPKQLMVGSGEFQFINCTASCTDPKRLVLETALNKTLLESQTQWKLFKVYNISKDEELLCSSTCGGKQETKVFHITVFYPPKQVLLTLSPTTVAVGTLFTIECRVPAVAPLECLNVTLLRGTEILCNQTFVGTTLSPQDAVVTHNTTAHREDGLYNFSCEAQMDMRSCGGGLVHRVSDPQRLEVKEPVPNNQMRTIIIIVVVLLVLLVTSVLLYRYWWRPRHN